MPNKIENKNIASENETIVNYILADLEARGGSMKASFCAYDFSSVDFLASLFEKEH